MNHEQIAAATTAELVAYYNSHADKPVKKFADRKTAERRVIALIETLAPTSAEEPVDAPAAEEAPAPVIDKKAARAAEKAAAAALVAERLSAGQCPHCGGDASSQTGNGPEGTHKGDNETFCHECGGAYDNATGARRAPFGNTSATRAAAIAKTWQDPETAARRAARLKVSADGSDYSSVRQAFIALRLPLSKHIKFRGELRDAGALDFVHGDRTVSFRLLSAE